MRRIKISIAVSFLIIAVVGSTAFINYRTLPKINTDTKGFAVVELFTSEGCSSCPPADELVAKIQKESIGKPVYILSYHVDYWNRLGWKDVFSSADFSKRQNEYAGYLHLQSVYTPQIVINGKTEFVGSEENTLRNALRNSLQKAPLVQLSLTVLKTTEKQVGIKYNIDGADKNSVLLIALVQKNAKTKVERGENGGHTLSHIQIVRKLQRVSLNSKDGQTNVDFPNGFIAANYELIGLIQNISTGAVIGATKVEVLTNVDASVKNSK